MTQFFCDITSKSSQASVHLGDYDTTTVLDVMSQQKCVVKSRTLWHTSVLGSKVAWQYVIMSRTLWRTTCSWILCRRYHVTYYPNINVRHKTLGVLTYPSVTQHPKIHMRYNIRDLMTCSCFWRLCHRTGASKCPGRYGVYFYDTERCVIRSWTIWRIAFGRYVVGRYVISVMRHKIQIPICAIMSGTLWLNPMWHNVQTHRCVLRSRVLWRIYAFGCYVTYGVCHSVPDVMTHFLMTRGRASQGPGQYDAFFGTLCLRTLWRTM